MFLLNRDTACIIIVEEINPLHPIMFLLNLNLSDAIADLFRFTSHYVPIKSGLFKVNSENGVLYIPLCSY